ncbi:hypothetical protein PAE9249_04724 [Paenibacillus sp. CECT 9249]|nr:hypothetical protein PAE9249_04724 [Paenibacillus sp. CECT 9249]
MSGSGERSIVRLNENGILLGVMKTLSMWLIFALLSAVMAALVAIFGKIGLSGIDANTATAVRAVIMALFLVLVVVFEGKISQVSTILANKKALTFIIASGLAGALSWLFYFLALKYGKVSQVGPIDKLSVVIAVILAVIFLGEKISLINAIGVFLIAAGALLVAVK